MYTTIEKKRIRKSFGKKQDVLPVPNLLTIQTDSFKNFIKKDPTGKQGLENVFRSIFPISNDKGTAELEYIDYSLGECEFNPLECQVRGRTYSRPLNVRLRLVAYEDNSKRKINNTKESDVFLGELPMMTDTGSFIINGTEQIIVSQVHRSPGIIYQSEDSKQAGNKTIYSASIIPYRGSWLDFEFDTKDTIAMRIDKKKKIPATTILKALNYTDEQILSSFYSVCHFRIIDGQVYCQTDDLQFLGAASYPWNIVVNGKDYTGNNKAEPISSPLYENVYTELVRDGVEWVPCPNNIIEGRILFENIISNTNGAVLYKTNDTLSDTADDVLELFAEHEIHEFSAIYHDQVEDGAYISETLRRDNATSREKALEEIFRICNSEDIESEFSGANAADAERYFDNLFFNPQTYDLSNVGRMKINQSIYSEEVEELLRAQDSFPEYSTLCGLDIVAALRKLIDVRNGVIPTDDVDHLSFRRIRSVGEMIENKFRVGLVRIEKAVKDKFSNSNLEDLTPKNLINSKQVVNTVREFFSTSKLSQFMDQNNALAEVTHKRRISALGEGGVTRERADFEIRDVHVTHYGRICPIETPEGQNIGLINTLATYARPDEYGFLETPYRVVKNGVVTDEIVYLSPISENSSKIVIAQANAILNPDNTFAQEFVPARCQCETGTFRPERITHMDVSSKQIVSIAAALIPFLEHDDAKRVLMGANMQKQAVPTLKPEAPLVGTGLERIVAADSGISIIAKRGGTVEYIDSSLIVIKVNEDELNPEIPDPGVDIYKVIKYRRSNQNTCINQSPCVSKGDVITKGEIIADGSATDLGELALGQNMRVAFMPWNGYNYEDSILVSERVVHENRFTSIHIQELEIKARELKNGEEEITRDVDGVSSEALSKLDESGIIHIGAEVKSGDILVGRMSPKSDANVSNSKESKLLSSIYGIKEIDSKDTSLRVPNSVSGTVIDVQVFTREGTEKDKRTLQIESELLAEAEKNIRTEVSIIKGAIVSRVKELFIRAGVDKSKVMNLDLLDLEKITCKDAKIATEIQGLIEEAKHQINSIPARLNAEKKKLEKCDNLQPNVIKHVKVLLAIKRQIQPADKMAGRHGNKGVISKINPIEDMPYDEDGNPIDIALNPIGVPSRMNLGQVLETHLGLAARGIGDKINKMLKQQESIQKLREFIQKAYDIGSTVEKVDLSKLTDEEVLTLAKNLRKGMPVATPVFEGAKEDEIREMLELAELPTNGQITLYDGLTGRKFDRPVTVGYMYMLKLNHLVDDKMHARSVGSYSLITQQPLGGKAQFGGQRFGEMEVWALEAYGAAYTLQEMLTVKSDDIEGRKEIFNNIINGRHDMSPNLPELFHVLVKELRSLGLNIDFDKD